MSGNARRQPFDGRRHRLVYAKLIAASLAAFAVGVGCADSSLPCGSSVVVEVETDAEMFTARFRGGSSDLGADCQSGSQPECDDTTYGKRMSFFVDPGSPYPYQLTLTRFGTGETLEYTIGAEGRTCDTECCGFTDRIQANFSDE